MNGLAERIQERLQATGKTARGASLEAGLGADAIRIILDGRSASPRMKTISALAEVLDCSVAHLMGDELPLHRNIRNRMTALGLNPFSLAAKAGLDRDYVRNIFRGKSVSPGVDGLGKIATALGVTIADLLSSDASVTEPGSSGCPGDVFQPVSRPTGPTEGAATLDLKTVQALGSAVRALELIELCSGQSVRMLQAIAREARAEVREILGEGDKP